MSMIAPYGAWRSPVLPAILAESGIGLSHLQTSGDRLYWLELRPTEKGRSVLVERRADGQQRDITPPDYSVRSRVHEYGGGAYRVADDVVYFVNDEDQRLYRQPLNGTPEAITPAPASLRALRYADIRLAPNGAWLVCVREHHHGDAVDNEVVRVALDGSGTVTVIASGYDFYANPRFSPDGRQLAYVAWNHPNMPWDDTELWVVPVNADGTVGAGRTVVANAGESVMQPEWHSDGTLYFISDRTNWWNLYRERNGTIESVFPIEGEIGYAAWQFDTNRYDFLPDGTLVTAYTQNSVDYLVQIAPDGTVTPLDSGDYSTFRIVVVAGTRIYALAGGGDPPRRDYRGG